MPRASEAGRSDENDPKRASLWLSSCAATNDRTLTRKTGLRDLISEAEFSEMRMHGPKIANHVAEIVAEVRRGTLAAVH
jgi:hypothetical protein